MKERRSPFSRVVTSSDAAAGAALGFLGSSPLSFRKGIQERTERLAAAAADGAGAEVVWLALPAAAVAVAADASGVAGDPASLIPAVPASRLPDGVDCSR